MSGRNSHSKADVGGGRSALLYLVGSLFQGLGLVLIQPFAVRLLDDVQWGLVSTAIVTIQVVVVLLSAGLPLAITRLWFDPENGQDRARAMYGFLAVGCLLIGASTAASLAGVAPGGNGPPGTTILAMVIIGLLGTVLGAQAVLRAQDRPVAFVTLSVLSSVFANLAGLVAIVVFNASAVTFISAYGVAVLLSCGVAVLFVRPRAPWSVRGVIGESMRIAGPLLPHTAALMLLTQGAVLLLATVSGSVVAGQYGAVLIFALGPLTILNALNNSWSTRTMSAQPDELAGRIRAVSREAAVSALIVGVLASAAANVGSHVLTTDAAALTATAQVLPLVSVGYALFLIATNCLYVVRRTRAMAYATPAVLAATTLLALAPAAGSMLTLLGVVHAAGFAVLGLVYWRIVRTHTGPGGLSLRVFLLAAGAHAVVVVVLSLAPASIVWGLAEAALATLLVGIAAYLWLRRRQSNSKDVTEPIGGR